VDMAEIAALFRGIPDNLSGAVRASECQSRIRALAT
jgi:hypothetical protein